mgnify:CR=1 FL=1
MGERRSMNEALALTPEKLAFIHGAAEVSAETKTDALEQTARRETPDTPRIVTMAVNRNEESANFAAGFEPAAAQIQKL